MKYSKIRKLDVTNGPGIRVSLFVSGCSHNCEGCFNKDQQDFNYGDDWTEETEKYFLDLVSNPVVVGLNILGGEPLQQTMDSSLLDLLTKVNEIYPDTDIWLWTGDVVVEAIINAKYLALVNGVDVLIDGRFEIDKRNIKLKYRGSENQRVIDVKASLASCEPVEYPI
ncbi:anaerobic ribonucleoside-triphosphate reductase activating protein [Peptostreptococcus stomatis]|uniref:anaerobic ribonucleoside-triphosphate reductase activating protein n=1 Tax=Peptostreptococcus stomatis TaxID=341694 RepID=UPI0028EBDEEC|nr:anaerobic ribonucleoside-triphosphate reductase activating protein [Peptostreptococcus stomatis]